MDPLLTSPVEIQGRDQILFCLFLQQRGDRVVVEQEA